MTILSVTRFRTCGACGVTYPQTLRFFNKNHKRGRWKSWCKTCDSLYSKNYRRKNKTTLSRKNKEYRESNRELVLEQKRESYYRNREATLAKQAANTERRRERYKANPERERERSRKWAKANPDKVKEALRNWRKKNPGKYAEDRHKRRARKAAVEHIPYTNEDINALWHEQGGCCYYCGVPVFGLYHRDHKQPVSRGGADALWNLCIACPFCNISKKDKTEQEFIDYRAGRTT